MEIKNNEERIKEFKSKIIEILPNQCDLALLNDFLVALSRSELSIVRFLVSNEFLSKEDAISDVQNVKKQMIKLIKEVEVK